MSGDEQTDKVLQSECPRLSEKVHVVFLRDSRRCECPVSRQTDGELFRQTYLIVQMARRLTSCKSHLEEGSPRAIVARHLVDARDT
jgi:hypothetical protein